MPRPGKNPLATTLPLQLFGFQRGNAKMLETAV